MFPARCRAAYHRRAVRQQLGVLGPALLVLSCASARVGPCAGAAHPGARARLGQWYGLTAPTLARPITPAELSRAALSRATVARLAALFEGAIGRGFWLAGRFHVPESGGEATLDGELRLHEMSDPSREAARELASRLHDPEAVAELWDERQAELGPLDVGGILGFAIARFRREGAAAAAGVRITATALAENAAGTFVFEPRAQLALIVATDWCGRYVGRWHTHPPHYAEAGWTGGDVPSFEDMQNAARDGQFLTVAFQPDGFDLYDASALGEAGRVDLALLKLTRYRSAAWRERFGRLHATLRPR